MTKQHLNNTSESPETTRKGEKVLCEMFTTVGSKLYNAVAKTYNSVVVMTKHKVEKNCVEM